MFPNDPKWVTSLKEQYISEIITLLNECDDVSLLDLLLRILLKH